MADVSHDASISPPVPVVTVKLPTAFHPVTGGKRQVSAEGGCVRDALNDLGRTFPRMCDRLMNEDGTIKRYMNVYRNDSDIRHLAGLDTKLENHDVIWIIPAVAGGAGAVPV